MLLKRIENRDNRVLIFYSKNLLTVSTQQSSLYPNGPFPSNNAVDTLLHFYQWQRQEALSPFPFIEVLPNDLEIAFKLFCEKNNLKVEKVKYYSLRQLLFLGTIHPMPGFIPKSHISTYRL
jgi:hypothetical protein